MRYCMVKGIFCEYATEFGYCEYTACAKPQSYQTAPVADVVEVTRCQYCRHWVPHMHGCGRNPSVESWEENDFCSYGKRRKNDE